MLTRETALGAPVVVSVVDDRRGNLTLTSPAGRAHRVDQVRKSADRHVAATDGVTVRNRLARPEQGEVGASAPRPSVRGAVGIASRPPAEKATRAALPRGVAPRQA
ncbi:hypothetical protein Acsp06_60930 [Actinomycetospora sp. NBRC 106375]|nr:hypothetical protein Acsp06_60930 [Actinomycetospora sp. NBRC 106375]